MKRIMWFLLLTFVFYMFVPLNAQLSEEQKRLVLQEIIEETKYNEELMKQIADVSARINTIKLVYRSNVDNKIAEAVNQNNITLASDYFDVYATALDTLVVTNPRMAKRIVAKLSALYEKVPSVWDRIYYYSGAIEYFLVSYEQAEKNLLTMLELYPSSVKKSNAVSLLLKTYISSNQESKAVPFITKNLATFDSENSYFAGHIYFALEQDANALQMFSKVSNTKYDSEAQKMVALIAIFLESPQAAQQKLLAMQSAEPSNPFILLSLARVAGMMGNWSESENYYRQYGQSNKSYNAMYAQYEMAMAYLNAGNQQRASEILYQLLQSNDLGDFISPVLYVWSELVASTGNLEFATQKVEQVNTQIEITKTMLPIKLAYMNRLITLKDNFLTNPDITALSKITADVNTISTAIDSLNAKLSVISLGISSTSLKRWQLYEKQLIISYLDLLDSYLGAYNLRNFPDSTSIKQLEALESIYAQQIVQIENIRQSLQKSEAENPALALRNEIEQSIETYDRVINSLNQAKLSNSTLYSPAELDSLLLVYERYKSESIMMLDYYDYDNTLFLAVMEQCALADEENNQLLSLLPALKEQYRVSYPMRISEGELRNIRKDIDDIIVLAPEYKNSIGNQQTFLTRLSDEMQFIDIHIAFVETGYYDKQKEQTQYTLSFEQSNKLVSENMKRKQIVYDRLTTFLDRHQDFTGLKSSTNYPLYISKANLYYHIAELSYSLWLDKPEIALGYFRQVNKYDPNFYNRDAVLYNVAYLSSIITKDRIEKGLLSYSGDDLIKPANLRYSEESYGESIQAYKELIESHKSSPLHSESIMRLGYIFFEIGTDADRPIEYYELARTYYDQLVNGPKDKYHYQALYQRGWTWLNSSSEEAYVNAMNDFVAILTAIDQGALSDSTEAIDYTVASLKNIGYCLIGLDGANIGVESKGAKYAEISLSKLVNDKNRNHIIDEAIAQKMKLYLPMQVVDFMNVKINLDPLSADNPSIADSICTIYSMYPNQLRSNSPVDSVITAERIKMIEKYGPNSAWFVENKDKDITKQLAIIKKTYNYVEGKANDRFFDNPTEENFRIYTNLIDSYTAYPALHDSLFASWRKEKQTNIIALGNALAERTKNPIFYIQTSKRIYAYNDTDTLHNSYFNFEGLAYQSIGIVADSLRADYLNRQSQNPIPNIPATDDSLNALYEYAANRFGNVLLNDKYRTPQTDRMYINIILKQAELARERNDLNKSRSYYVTIIDFKGDVSREIMRSAYVNLAEIAESSQNFAEAEKWYRNSEEYALNNADRDNLHQLALIQIQNSVEFAKTNGNNKFAAEEYLRLASEFAAKDPSAAIKAKAAAQESYWVAKEYQKSIDLLIEIAATKSTAKDVLTFYQTAWVLADSVGYAAQSDSLKQAFISQFPASNEAFELRLIQINKFAANTATAKQAAEMFLALYQDVVNKRIDSGDRKAEELYLEAMANYSKAGEASEEQKLAESFISLYPNHPRTIDIMEFVAGKYLSQGDTLRHEQMARSIFRKDKNRKGMYENLAKVKLSKINSEYVSAYKAKDWTLAFTKRDAFKKMHSDFEKEGLTLEFTVIYERFAEAEKEYATIQERLAYLKKFDTQLATLENGFPKKSPAELIIVKNITSWTKNLVGGKDNRIPNFKTSVDRQVKQITDLIASSAKYDLDEERKLKALNLICKYYEHGANVIRTQIDTYMRIAGDFQTLKRTYGEEAVMEMFNEAKAGHSLDVLAKAAPYYGLIYRSYFIPGYQNAIVQHAYDMLTANGWLPRYKIEESTLSRDWSISLVSVDDSTFVTPYVSEISTKSTPNGKILSLLNVPPNKGVILRKELKTKVAPDFLIANVMANFTKTSDVFDDSNIRINGQDATFNPIPIELMETGNPVSTRYAISFGNALLKDSSNQLELRFYNYSAESIPFAMNLMVISDSAKIEAAIPIETVSIISDENWQYSIRSTGSTAWKFASQASSFGFEKNQWYEMESSPAKAIWVATEDNQDTLKVVFKKDFRFDGVLKDGSISYIAPDTATITLNGREIVSASPLNYDDESGLVFAGKVTLRADLLRQGVNSLEISVDNQSQWKGMAAEINMTVSHPE